MTAKQRDAWASFDGVEWQPFRDAWLARGLRLPPFGQADDEADSSQRARLWRIADARPTDLGRWVAEAPAGAKAGDVVAFVFGRWNALAAEVAAEAEVPTDGGPSRVEAAESIGRILGRVNGAAPEVLDAFGD